MKYLVHYLRLAIVIALPVAIGRLLLDSMSPWAAVGVAAAIAVASSALGALLLKTATVGRITWRNYVGGWLLPWGYMLGRGRLAGIAAVSAAVWTLLAASAILATASATGAAPPGPVATVPAAAATTPWLLVLAWIVNGGALLYVVSLLSKNYSPTSSAARPLRRAIGVLTVLLVASIVMHACGYTTLATWVAGGPLLVLGTFYGLWIALLLILGRNARWN